MEQVSMLEFRRNARRLIERLEQGECFRLTYRNRTVAELHPAAAQGTVADDDPIYRVAEDAEGLGGGLTARGADDLLYGP